MCHLELEEIKTCLQRVLVAGVDITSPLHLLILPAGVCCDTAGVIFLQHSIDWVHWHLVLLAGERQENVKQGGVFVELSCGKKRTLHLI